MRIIEDNDYWSKTDFDKNKIRSDIERGERLWLTLDFIAIDINKSLVKLDRSLKNSSFNHQLDFKINADIDTFIVENCFGERNTIASLSEMIYKEQSHCNNNKVWYRWVILKTNSCPKAYLVLGKLKIPIVIIRPQLLYSQYYIINGIKQGLIDSEHWHVFELRIQEDFAMNILRPCFEEFGTIESLVK